MKKLILTCALMTFGLMAFAQSLNTLTAKEKRLGSNCYLTERP